MASFKSYFWWILIVVCSSLLRPIALISYAEFRDDIMCMRTAEIGNFQLL